MTSAADMSRQRQPKKKFWTRQVSDVARIELYALFLLFLFVSGLAYSIAADWHAENHRRERLRLDDQIATMNRYKLCREKTGDKTACYVAIYVRGQ